MTTTPTTPDAQEPTPTGGWWQRLTTGQAHIDFVGRSKLWLYLALGILAVAVLAVLVRGLNFSIEFTGGSAFTVQDAQGDFTADDLRDALAELGIDDVLAQVVDGGGGAQVSTPALTELEGVTEPEVIDAIAEVTGADPQDVSVTSVGPRWGQQVTAQALRGLVVFLVLVVLYISIRFEWRMAVAAVATLAHDIVASVGLYALVGFRISPGSIVAFLTILGYSLYDTVVVFDRVKEDTAKLTSVSTASYGEVANQALNEVLVRSISTSMTSLLPVASLLFIGSTLLGAETLADLALALLIGMAVGTWSSITIATPLLVWLKERDPRYAEHRARGRRAAAS